MSWNWLLIMNLKGSMSYFYSGAPWFQGCSSFKQDLSSLSRNQTQVAVVKALNPSHQTTRTNRLDVGLWSLSSLERSSAKRLRVVKQVKRLFIYLFIYLFCFLGPHSQHMEVPRLGVKSELQPPAYATATATSDLSRIFDLYHSSRQRQILNPRSEARDQTCNLMVPNWIRFCCATMATPKMVIKREKICRQTRMDSERVMHFWGCLNHL